MTIDICQHRRVAKKLTGFALPWFGLSWENTDGEKNVAQRVINFLEDRRLIYGSRDLEDRFHCFRSAQDVRAYLTQEINGTKLGSGLNDSLKRMRAAARRFVDSAGPEGRRWLNPERFVGSTDPFSLALGDFRAVMGLHIAQLAERYDIEVDEDLAKILPPKPRKGD